MQLFLYSDEEGGSSVTYYDTSGFVNADTIFLANGAKHVTLYKYGKSHKLTELLRYYQKKKLWYRDVYSYDDNGFLQRMTVINGNIDTTIDNKENYSFPSDTSLITIITILKKNIKVRTVYVYNKDGLLLNNINAGPPFILYASFYNYNKDKLNISLINYEINLITGLQLKTDEMDFIYNDYGNVVHQVQYNYKFNVTATTTFSYKYDSHSNYTYRAMVTTNTLKNSKPIVYIEERKIEYY